MADQYGGNGSGGVMMLEGQYAGSRIEMRPGERIIIGRDPSKCALICDSEKISRVHLSIVYDSGRYRVTDTSTNGTISSETGKLIKNQTVVLHGGTRLRLGQCDEIIRLL